MSETVSRQLLSSVESAHEILSDWLAVRGCEALLISPERTHTAAHISTHSIIVVTGSQALVNSLATQLAQTPPPPVLLIIDSNQSPADFVPLLRKTIVDILPLPVSYELFCCHLDQLEKVRSLQQENHEYATSISKQLDILAERDGLTGLFNRRAFFSRLQRQMTAALTNNLELSICIINIDYFKKVNQNIGREHADQLLNEFAARLTVAMKDKGTCFRFSGDDFIIMIPVADPNEVRKLAGDITATCCSNPFLEGHTPQKITVSAGIASLLQHRPQNSNEFLNMAEAALYIAKAEGRNRISCYPLNARTGEYQSQHSLLFVRYTIANILNKTRDATINSLKLLAQNIVGTTLEDQLALLNRYMHLFGCRLGLPDSHIRTFENAATLHICFKLLLYHDLISKSAELDQSERKAMNDLPLKLSELTETFDYFAHERQILETHSEKFDGSGFPYGLQGSEIPLGARIFNIVDSVIAMSSDRPYRTKLSGGEILQQLRDGAGKQFDPTLVLHLIDIIKENNLLSLDMNALVQTQQELIDQFPELHK